MADFVHLHLHSEYSLLNSTCRISDIAVEAEKRGQSAVAVTDSCVMYGVIPFYKSCLKTGIKPIIGAEISYCHNNSNYSLVLLCKDKNGYSNLIKLISEDRIDFESLKEFSDGLIALSSGANGEIDRFLSDSNTESAEFTALSFKDIFGEDFYLEINRFGYGVRAAYESELVKLSNKLNVQLVATNDVRFINKSDYNSYKILTKIAGNEDVITTNEQYLKDSDEMEKLFSDLPEALSNTIRIADLCNLTFEFGNTKIPVFKCEDGKSEYDFLSELTQKGLEDRINSGRIDLSHTDVAVYRERINRELSVIESMGYCGYFLIVRDFVNYAKSIDIPVGPGRGSGAGSLVAFLIGITDVDPVRFDLLFERFLNPERVSMPDFDIDFGDTRRNEVIDYVREKYGYDHTAQIITFGTLAAKAVIRDVGKAMSLSQDTINEVSAQIPRELNVTIDSALKQSSLRELYDSDYQVKELVDISKKLEGLPRHISIHAAGVVITEKPINDYVPLTKSGEVSITQYDMNSVQELGLLKFDFLAIRYLTVIKNTENQIKKDYPYFSLDNVPFDDPKAFELISKGNTDGVFQLESQGIKNVLRQFKPENLEDIIAVIALYRPGPMSSIPRYIAARHGKGGGEYYHELIRPILEPTYGCIVYQEQVMRIFCTAAGYSLGHADVVRRAISKKHADELLKEKDSFISGAVNNGINENIASHIFKDIEDFADYAFNKSHAAAYAVLSYRTAYLKAHYPAMYYASLITSVSDSIEKISEYVTEIRKQGIAVKTPDVNVSETGFTAHDNVIVFGLGCIKNVGISFCVGLVEERKAGGPFSDYLQFMKRMSAKGMNRRQAEALIKSGALDNLGTKRSVMLASYEKLVSGVSVRDEAQLDLFSQSGVDEYSGVVLEDVPELSSAEKSKQEFEYVGIRFNSGIFDNYSRAIETVKEDDISDSVLPGRAYTVCAIITDIRRKTDKNGNPMAFASFETKSGFSFEAVMFSNVLESVPVIDDLVKLSLLASLNDGKIRFRVKGLEKLRTNEEISAAEPKKQKLYIKVDTIDNPAIIRLYALVDVFSGDTEIVIFDSAKNKASKLVGKRISINNITLSELYKLFGKDSVILK